MFPAQAQRRKESTQDKLPFNSLRLCVFAGTSFVAFIIIDTQRGAVISSGNNAHIPAHKKPEFNSRKIAHTG